MTKLVDLDLSDVKALAARFGDADRVIGYEMRAAGVQIMEATRRFAIDNAPVDTGTLRNSIGVISFNASYPDFDIEVAAQTDYARYVEEGTRSFGGYFYMQRAAEQVTPHAQERIDLAVRRATEKLAGG